MRQLELRTLDVAGVLQRYHLAGKGRVTCVVQPSGPGLSWELARMPLLEQVATMVYIEPIGTGLSGRLPPGEPYSLGRYAAHLAAVIGALNADLIVVLGHAHGGSVAMEYITRYQSAPGGLVLVAATPVGNDAFLRETFEKLNGFAMSKGGIHPEALDCVGAFLSVLDARSDAELTSAVKRIFPAYFSDYWDPRINSYLFETRSTVRAWAEPARRGALERSDFRRLLSDIAVPSLIVAGRQDMIVGPRWSRMIAANLQRAQFVEMDNTGHIAHLERPVEFAQVVGDFFSKLASRLPAGQELKARSESQ